MKCSSISSPSECWVYQTDSVNRSIFSSVLVCLLGGSVLADDYPWLSILDPNKGVQESGQRLIALEFGLQPLEPESSDQVRELLIGVHGWRSRGYEWVYPLLTMDNDETHTYFFNWDTTEVQCLRDTVDSLHAAILSEAENLQNIEQVSLVGHSLGGMVVAQLADIWDSAIELSIHTVASPLAMLDENGNESCEQQLPKNRSAEVKFFQWRTQFELDNAFNQLDTNPMIAEIPNSVVVTLPDTYRGRRLGHNWSISYVAERIAER